jgi:pimeloyl-ACP methyl ester carboxylesterase
MSDTQPDRPAVVFIHGVGGSARVWAPQAASLAAAGYTPVALDLPGYGGRPPVDTLGFEGLAADVESQIEARGLDRPVLVGHSMGGMVAQTMLRRRPDGYSAAVLACTSPAFGNADGEFQKAFVADRIGPVDAGKAMADLAPGLVARMVGPAAEAAGKERAIEVMSAVPPATYRAAVRCLVTFDERGSLAGIRVPVLCLAGEADRTAPAQVMERMAARIPGARFASLPGAGHLPNLETPAAFDAAILHFLRQALAPAT